MVAALVGVWISVVLSDTPAAPLGLASVLVLLFIALDLRRPLPAESGTEVALTRRLSEHSVLMGVPVLVELTAENRGDDVERLLIRDAPPALEKASAFRGIPAPRASVTKGSTTLLCGLGRGEKVTLRYEVTFTEPGTYRFEATSVMVRSMFGLAERRTAVASPFGVRVYPRRLVKSVDTGPARAFGWAGVTPSKYRGGRLEFMDIRRYIWGDPLKDVNWRASARAGTMLVNEWRVERGLDCVVIVDLSASSLPRVGEWNARGEVITSAYELASSLIAEGNRVGLLVLGRSLDKVRPSFGPKQLRAMVDVLVESAEGEIWNMKHTEQALELFFRRQYTMRKGTLFFVFAWPTAELVKAVSTLSSKGFACNSVLVNSLAGEERALREQKVLAPKEIGFGEAFARAEAASFRAMLSPYSKVFVWTAGEGMTEEARRAAA